MKQPRRSVGSSDEDLELACKSLRRVEKDLAFEVAEAYQDRRMENFVDALLTFQVLAQAVSLLCGSARR